MLPDEQSLMSQAAEGNRNASGRLYTYYFPFLFDSVFFICKSKEDTEEIIHDAFMKIWAKKETLSMVRSFGYRQTKT